MSLDVLITTEQISARIRELGRQISSDYQGKTVHLVCVLKGAHMFAADLARAIDIPVTLDFMAVSSYGKSTSTSGEVQLTKDLDLAIEGKHVIVVEDIADTGLTLNYLLTMLRTRRPSSIKVAAFLSKPSRRTIDVAVDYVGFEVPDRFVVGYGLDQDQRYRNLPYVAAVDL
ncbi:MAG TPA: hypoxanthine phosphoribosyltransferase [Vicinamibacteria bacterium]|nr:hypoxanthine phosphoribosyltransferase [Vicinamibacteria bacterium]